MKNTGKNGVSTVTKKTKYDAPNLKNCMPRSPIDKENKAGNSSPSTSNLVITMMSKRVGPIATKEKMKPFMEVT